MNTVTQSTIPSVELLTWDVSRYHAAARAGLLGDRQLELLDGLITVVPYPDQIHEWIIRQIIKLLMPRLGAAALIDKGQPVYLSETSEPIPDIVVLKPQAPAYRAHLKSSDSCATMKEDAKAKENELLKQFDQ